MTTITDIERGLVARYLVRLLSRPDLTLRAVRGLLVWLNERSDVLSLPLPPPLIEALGGYMTYKPAEFERAWNRHKKEVLSAFDRAATETPRPEPMATNVERLVDALGLPNAAWRLLGLFACSTRFEQVQYLAIAAADYCGPITRAVSLMCDVHPRATEELLSPGGELVAAGLLQVRDTSMTLAGYEARYTIPSRVNSCLERTFGTFDEMRNALLGDPLVSSVTMEDYEHVMADRDLIAGVLRGAVDGGVAGVNVLLYGPPGSGKTELAKVAAAAAGAALFATGEAVGGEGESDRSERLADITFSQRLLSAQKRTAILFDEMEDVAVHLIKRGGSKVYLNRLLETNPVPIVWTSNELQHIDPALLRRMTLAVELKRPPAIQRQRILERLATRMEFALSTPDAEALARRLDATPAIYENALKAAKLSGGGAEAVERAALGIVRAVSGTVARKSGAVPDFDPLLVCSDQDLAGLADRLVAAQARAFSICLSGPPGTGKSAFARYLSRRLGLELIQKRASDILGPYLGETERHIANAFEESREANAMLVFDEADSLLLDRRDATRSWEITQVNEMLTWMEDHPLPVCFTTNFMERVDTASLRRFTFQVVLSYLDKPGLRRAWQVFFHSDRIPPDAAGIANLTPGDFAKARKQAEVLGVINDPMRLTEIMLDISRSKPDARGSLGFVR